VSDAGNRAAREPSRRIELLVGLALLVLVSSTLAAGAWWGFPVQDDTYMIRLLRLGGPGLILAEHADRPVVGRLIAGCVRLVGEHRAPYIAVGLLFWMGLAAEGALLWIRLFPEWSYAWPAVALAVVAPVVTLVQFTTLTTVFPCVLPVVLVLAGLLVLLGRPEAGVGAGTRIAAALLAASAAVVSEYALATALAAATYLLLRRRWRGALSLLAGVSVGYAVFRAISDVTLRMTTDPDVQLETVLQQPWSPPLRTLSAAWDCIVGSWGRAAAGLQIEWASKSTLFAAGVALAAAICAAALRMDRAAADPPGSVGGRLLAVIAAVIAGLAPAFVIRSFPLSRVFETRYFLPVLVFASCATVAGLLSLARPRFASLVLLAVVFLSVDRLVLRAIEEKRLQSELERFGDRVRPFVGREEGLVVVVTPDRIGVSPEETMAKATYRWAFPQAGRFWIVRSAYAEARFGPRSGCRRVESLPVAPSRRAGARGRLEQVIRWPHADEPIRLILWDASHSDEADLEPYFRGCPARSSQDPPPDR
jgi:hypothetical protein